MRGKEWTSQAHRASLQRLMDPGPLLSLWHRAWCWDRSWRKGDESLDEGARREAALGRACIPEEYRLLLKKKVC